MKQARSDWTSAVLVCGKCSKKIDGGFGPKRSERLAKALRGVFVHDGTWSSFRGRRHGRPVPPTVPGSRS